MLRILWFGEKVDQKNCQTISHHPPPDVCAEKFPLVSMGARAEGLASADPVARTTISASGNFLVLLCFWRSWCYCSSWSVFFYKNLNTNNPDYTDFKCQTIALSSLRSQRMCCSSAWILSSSICGNCMWPEIQTINIMGLGFLKLI